MADVSTTRLGKTFRSASERSWAAAPASSPPAPSSEMASKVANPIGPPLRVPDAHAILTPKPLGSIRPSLALAADPRVAPPSRDDGHAQSSLLGLGRDRGAIIRSIQVVSALARPLLEVRHVGGVRRRCACRTFQPLSSADG